MISLSGWGALYLAFITNVVDISFIGPEHLDAVADSAQSVQNFWNISTDIPQLIRTDERFKCAALSFVCNEFLEPVRICGVVAFTVPISEAISKARGLKN